MIIITDASGNLQSPTIPENVYQGSNNANSIVFLNPLPQSNSAYIAFRLPNGLLTEPSLMTPYSDIPSEYNLNAWIKDIDETLTNLYGIVEYQIKLINSNGTIIASIMGTFNVLKGVAPILPATPTQTIYNEILQALSEINQDIENGYVVSKGTLPYDETFSYPINANVWDKETNTIYTSLIAENLGNALTDTTKWVATGLVSAEVIDDKIAVHNTSLTAHEDLFKTKVDKEVKDIENRKVTIENTGEQFKVITFNPLGFRTTISSTSKGISLSSEALNIDTEKSLYVSSGGIYYRKSVGNSSEIATKQDIENITSVQIRNVNGESINATLATVQTVATNYIVANYDRQPQTFDGLILTLTDQNNDKVQYVYSEASTSWVDTGSNNVDLSNYFTKTETQALVAGIKEQITITTWTALSNATPYNFSATVTLINTIGTDSVVELINNQAVLFATYGFAIGTITGQSLTIYSIGQPSESVTLTIKVGE